MVDARAVLPSNRLVVVMVGLPARGKTFTARKIARFLQWRGWSARVFNVGNYRRERFGAKVPHSFFNPDNPCVHSDAWSPDVAAGGTVLQKTVLSVYRAPMAPAIDQFEREMQVEQTPQLDR